MKPVQLNELGISGDTVAQATVSLLLSCKTHYTSVVTASIVTHGKVVGTAQDAVIQLLAIDALIGHLSK